MSSNLPPGVSEGMIPGNRSEDAELKAVQESMIDFFAKHSLHPEEYHIVTSVGLEAVMSARRYAEIVTGKEGKGMGVGSEKCILDSSVEDLKLCYVSGPWAWFTTKEVKDQWGDDWNDIPYEHNAGDPYTYHENNAKRGEKPWKLKKVAWEGPFVQPCDGHLNSPFSVNQINAGYIAWLRTESWSKMQVSIPAGTTLQKFEELVKSVGGSVCSVDILPG